jgi:hypothetical protein
MCSSHENNTKTFGMSDPIVLIILILMGVYGFF